jgi:hypothetical protein
LGILLESCSALESSAATFDFGYLVLFQPSGLRGSNNPSGIGDVDNWLSVLEDNVGKNTPSRTKAGYKPSVFGGKNTPSSMRVEYRALELGGKNTPSRIRNEYSPSGFGGKNTASGLGDNNYAV